MGGRVVTTQPDADDAGESRLDAILPRQIRSELERRYWRPIEIEATVERFIDDPGFHRDPHGHVALYADHGVVHVRDVAVRLLDMIGGLNGVLIAQRDPVRLEFIRGLSAP